MDPQAKIEKILRESNNQLYFKQIAKKTGLSDATVSKYVLRLEALGKVNIEKYLTAKLVEWVGKHE